MTINKLIKKLTTFKKKKEISAHLGPGCNIGVNMSKTKLNENMKLNYQTIQCSRVKLKKKLINLEKKKDLCQPLNLETTGIRLRITQ